MNAYEKRTAPTVGEEGTAMTPDRYVRNTVSCCVATMQRYHDEGRGRRATILMIAEVEAHAAWFVELNLSREEITEQILKPVGEALIAGYGLELGGRLKDEFLEAFDGFEAFARIPGHVPDVESTTPDPGTERLD